MPTTTCARCTGNGSTLGLLGKRRRVGADPAPGRDNADLPELPKSETSVVSESAGLLWLGSARNEKTSEKRKVGKSESQCYDSSPIYTYFLTLLTYDAPPESPYSSGPPTGPLEPMDRLMPNPYPN